MTIEEAKAYFGENFVIPNLGYFNEESLFKTTNKISKPKKGQVYLYKPNMYEKWIVDLLGRQVIGKWVRLKVTYRRGGVAFVKFPDYPNVNEEVHIEDGSMVAKQLIPEVLSLKEFGWKNKDLIFAFNTLDGRVKIID